MPPCSCHATRLTSRSFALASSLPTLVFTALLRCYVPPLAQVRRTTREGPCRCECFVYVRPCSCAVAACEARDLTAACPARAFVYCSFFSPALPPRLGRRVCSRRVCSTLVGPSGLAFLPVLVNRASCQESRLLPCNTTVSWWRVRSRTKETPGDV